MLYSEELNRAMNLLAENPQVLFLGQSVGFSGNAIYKTLEGVPQDRRIELPVCEDMQMGISIGLALEGYIPISIYPRMDFLVIAMNQLVNHLDKIEEMSHGEYSPKVIIRTAVGSKTPLDGGLQHTSDYTSTLQRLFKNINTVKLDFIEAIVPAYMKALSNNKSSILVEKADLYFLEKQDET